MPQKKQQKLYEGHLPGLEVHSLHHNGWSWNIKRWYISTFWPTFQFLHIYSSPWRNLSTHMLLLAFPLDPMAPVHVSFPLRFLLVWKKQFCFGCYIISLVLVFLWFGKWVNLVSDDGMGLVETEFSFSWYWPPFGFVATSSGMGFFPSRLCWQHWSWTREVSSNWWKEMAVFERCCSWSEILWKAHQQRPSSFKKACGRPDWPCCLWIHCSKGGTECFIFFSIGDVQQQCIQLSWCCAAPVQACSC